MPAEITPTKRYLVIFDSEDNDIGKRLYFIKTRLTSREETNKAVQRFLQEKWEHNPEEDNHLVEIIDLDDDSHIGSVIPTYDL